MAKKIEQKTQQEKTKVQTEETNGAKTNSCSSPLVREYSVDSEALLTALKKRNALSSENVFSWRMSFNVYQWVKYVGGSVGVLLAYVTIGFFLGKTFKIGLPFLNYAFDVVLALFLFTILGGWWMIWLGMVRAYKQWKEDPAAFFNAKQTHFLGLYQGYEVIKGPMRMGSRNILGKATPWIVRVEYLTARGKKCFAQTFLGNTTILSQMNPGDELCICRVKGHFYNTFDVALIPCFIGEKHIPRIAYLRQMYEEQEYVRDMEELLAQRDEQQLNTRFPIQEYIPLDTIAEDVQYKARNANKMSETRIKKLSMLSGDGVGLIRSLWVGLILWVLASINVPDIVAQELTILPYNVVYYTLVNTIVALAFFMLSRAYRSVWLAMWYGLTKNKKEPKYTISHGYFVACNHCGADIGNYYYWLVDYQDEFGEIRQAYLHEDNYELLRHARPNLPLTIITVRTLWPYHQSFACISAYFKMHKEPLEVNLRNFNDC